MLKWLGSALVILCSAALSTGRVLRSRSRVRALNALIDGISRLHSELETDSLPEVLTHLSRSVPQPAAELFGNAAGLLSRKEMPFPSAWETAVRETSSLYLRPEEERSLLSLGETLGRCSAAEQYRVLERVSAKLQLFLELEERERLKQGQVFAAVGTGTGAMLALLLL